MGHNGEAAPHVCVPANKVSDLIFLLGALLNNLDCAITAAVLFWVLALLFFSKIKNYLCDDQYIT